MSYGGDPEDVITLRLRNQNGEEILFKFRKATKMQKIFNAYASKRGVSEHSLRFLIDGEWISPQQTAEMLDLEDNDVVDVYSETDPRVKNLKADSSSSASTSAETDAMSVMKDTILKELEENVSASASHPKTISVS